MRILIADHEQTVRSALRLVVRELTACAIAEPDSSLAVIEAADAATVLAALRRDDCQLLLLDWELPGMNAAELAQRVRRLSPGCLIVAMSGRAHGVPADRRAAVDAFVSKNDPPDELIRLIVRRLPQETATAGNP